MRTYADILHRSEQAERLDRATSVPMLGFVVGSALALLLWTAIGWLALAAIG